MNESTPKFTPWEARPYGESYAVFEGDKRICYVYAGFEDRSTEEAGVIAAKIAAAPDLYEACAAQERAEEAQANCEECSDAESFGELCGHCFPLFDDARLKRRAALSKATMTKQEER